MTSSVRSRGPASTSRPAASTARQTSQPTNLPPYQPLTHPLNPTAQHALHNLPTTHPLNELKRRLQIATNHLIDVTGDLNDQYLLKKTEFDKAKARKAARARGLESSQEANDDDDDADRRMDDAWNDVEDWTGRMEAGTRQVIDLQARVDNTENALKELSANVGHGRTATQSTLGASQFRPRSQRQRRPQHADAEDDEDEDNADHEGEPYTSPPALTVFREKISASEAKYTSLSLKDRYASHNNYIGFRQVVHESRHPNDDTPMPHASTWFPSSSNPAGTQQSSESSKSRSRSAADESHSDDDIQVAREKRSIRCPITLLPLVKPLTSTLCPHSFESEAILSMIDKSELRAHGPTTKPTLNTTNRGGVKAMKCPECEVLLTQDTLRVDPALVRKIKKIKEQERKQREGVDDEEAEEEEEDLGRAGRSRAEEVTSSPVRSKAEAVKRERMSQMGNTREISVVPDSQVVDLGDEEEDEEEDSE
ncbi:MAG: hypothetical protein Q9213_007692 [Squamulea squamosa]